MRPVPFLFIATLGAAMAVGCASQRPSVSVSDPCVYTQSHIAAVPTSLANLSSSAMGAVPFSTVTEEIHRYFRQVDGAPAALPGTGDRVAAATDPSGSGSKQEPNAAKAGEPSGKAANHPAPKTADTYLRMDRMLDSSQGTRVVAQFLATTIALEASARAGAPGASEAVGSKQPAASSQVESAGDATGSGNSGKVGGDGGSGKGGASGSGSSTAAGDSKSAEKGAADASMAKEYAELAQSMEESFRTLEQDSPFDRIDRAADFYTAFLLKVLPSVGNDSRLLPTRRLGSMGTRNAGGIPISDDLTARLASGDAARVLAQSRAAHAEVDQVNAQLQDAAAQLAERERQVAEASQAFLDTFPPDTLVERTLARAKDQLRSTVEEVMRRYGANPTTTSDGASLQTAIELAVEDDKELEWIRTAQPAAARLQRAEAAVAATRRQIAETNQSLAIANAAVDASSVSLAKFAQELRTLIPVGDKEPPITDEDVVSVDRLLLLTFQTHVDSGTTPNMMAGVRVRVVATGCDPRDPRGEVDGLPEEPEPRWPSADPSSWVKVIRLHPTRSYDLESQGFLDLVNELLSMKLSGSGSAGGSTTVAGSLSSDREEEARERRRFLSRLTKVTSFADAASHEFGWSFYPTNLTTNPRSLADRLGDLVTFRDGGRWKVNAYLEGGARDCAVWVIVPKQLTWIEFEVEYVTASVDPLELDRSAQRWYWNQNHLREGRMDHAEPRSTRRVRVDLPAWDKTEAEAFFSRPIPAKSPGT